MTTKHFFKKFFASLLFASLVYIGFGQDHLDTTTLDTVIANYPLSDTTLPYDSSIIAKADSIATHSSDTLSRLQIDSIMARLQFVKDSLIAREEFVRDSLLRRKQILDSVEYLRPRLQKILEAYFFASNNDPIARHNKISIVGDSTLDRFAHWLLPVGFVEPFRPWEGIMDLRQGSLTLKYDSKNKNVISIKSPEGSFRIQHHPGNRLLVLHGKTSFLTKHGNKFLKIPFDSVFYDNKGNILKIKRYANFYDSNEKYQKGKHLFEYLAQVKQYTYDGYGNVKTYQIVNFCERWKPYDPVKVCNIVDQTLSRNGDIYVVDRQHDPANKYTDGKYTYEYDAHNNLLSVAFKNNSGSENWKTYIERNEANNVSRYVFRNKGVVRTSILVNYYLDDPNAKHKVETITCVFEDDAVCYYQKNNTTGKQRVRDKLTLEWSPWR